MPYRFRVRWQFEPGRRVSGLDQPVTVALSPELSGCELSVVSEGDAFGGQNCVLKSPDFGNPDEALVASEKALVGLLLASLRRGYGVSMVERLPPGVV